MTLDVTIGEITLEPNGLNVIECPAADHNICNPAYTLHPKESYRSGSHDFWIFWRTYCGKLYYIFREHPCSNDPDIAKLKPHIDKINALSNQCEDETNKDRMMWFKYWANKAVELYGVNAGIKFS